MRDEFSTLDIVKTLGIPRERLRDWINKGFVRPTVPAEGQGTKAMFTRGDVYGVKLFHILIQSGLRRENAAFIVDSLRETKVLHLSKKILYGSVIEDGKVFFKYMPDHAYVRGINPKGGKILEDIHKYRAEYAENQDPLILKKIVTLEQKLKRSGWISGEEPQSILKDQNPYDWFKWNMFEGHEEDFDYWLSVNIINYESIRKAVDRILEILD